MTLQRSVPTFTGKSVVVLGVVLAATMIGPLVAVGVLTGVGFLPVESAARNLAFVFFLAGMVCVAIVGLWRRRAGVPWVMLGITWPTARLWHLLWQVPLGYLVVIAAMWVSQWLRGMPGQPPEKDSIGITADSPVVLLLLAFLAGVIMVPLWEELFFRGAVMGYLKQRWGTTVAVLGSAALFALCHPALEVTLYYFAFGLMCAWLRVFHRNLWGPLAFHMAINGPVTMTMILAVT